MGKRVVFNLGLFNFEEGLRRDGDVVDEQRAICVLKFFHFLPLHVSLLAVLAYVPRLQLATPGSLQPTVEQK